MRRLRCIRSICIDLIEGQDYIWLDDSFAEKFNMVRVVDESGEDYLYSKDLFTESDK